MVRDLCASFVKKVYLPAIKRQWPQGLEELTGMVAGSGVSLVDLMVLNAKDDLATTNSLMKNEMYPHASRDDIRDADDTISAYFPPATTGNDAITAHSWSASTPLDSGDCLVYLEIHHEP